MLVEIWSEGAISLGPRSLTQPRPTIFNMMAIMRSTPPIWPIISSETLSTDVHDQSCLILSRRTGSLGVFVARGTRFSTPTPGRATRRAHELFIDSVEGVETDYAIGAGP